MSSAEKRWEILSRSKGKNIADILLFNRGIKTDKQKKEFFHPTHPKDLTLKEVEIKKSEVEKALNRIKKAKKSGEKVIIYGDYDADGITATAILWETLSTAGLDVSPYIPERFTEGYGFNTDTISKLKSQNSNLGLIITVDHGITAKRQVEFAKKQGIDVIICDHHQLQKSKPKAFSVLHTTKIGGAEISWILSREIRKRFKIPSNKLPLGDRLDLAAIGAIADVLPLLGPNRCFAKHGLEALNETKRPGLKNLYEEAGIKPGTVGSFQVGYFIGPRINAMGRLKHGIESLRLLCYRTNEKAKIQSYLLGKTNQERQKIEEDVILHAKNLIEGRDMQRIVVVAHESYHEGVIGLAASRIVETYHRPAIVISKKDKISKGSARSIAGFDIFRAIMSFKEEFGIDGGGHTMAAGFSIATEKIDEFTKRINQYAQEFLKEETLSKRIKIDTEIHFNQINLKLLQTLKSFEPTGSGNPTPVFATSGAMVVDARGVGADAKHLKLTVQEAGVKINGIAFRKGDILPELSPKIPVDIAYNISEDNWNGRRGLQLEVRDIKWKKNSKI